MSPDPTTQTPPNPKPHRDPIESVVWLLFAGVFIAVGLAIGIAIWAPSDGQTFQLLSGVVSGFLGALLMRVKQSDNNRTPAAPPAPGAEVKP